MNALPAEILSGGGEMGRRMRAYDWSCSPLGRPSTWPQALRTAVSIMLNSGHPMFVAWGPSLTFLFNDAYMPILGEKLPGALGRPFAELWADIWDDVGPTAERALAGEATWFENRKLVMERYGYREETYFNFSYSPIRDESGQVEGLFCACTETTETVTTTRRLRATEAALRRTNESLQAEREAVQAANRRLIAETEHLRELFEQAPGFIAITRGPEHIFELTNSAYLRLVGRNNLVGKPARKVLPDVEGQGFFALLDEVYRSGKAYVGRRQPIELRRSHDGATEQRFLDFVYQPILDAEGAISGLFIEGSDVTERVRAEEALRRLTETLEEQVEVRTRDLRQAEAALRQSQKMEAVGRLTGGIAHDFNNLLQAIVGSLGLAQRRLTRGETDTVERLLASALRSTDRAAALIHRLLAFSRRQPLSPEAVDVNALVLSMEDLLRRTLGEGVHLRLVLAQDAWPALCDPHQLESAVLNLAINARDAMPNGGELRIETRSEPNPNLPDDTPSGDYVRISVSDTGSGMSPDVAARAFDPFFTTKAQGQGTGLGLSMIYGFARQSEGHVSIDSEVGCGTTVELYLPRAERPAPGASVQAPEEPARATDSDKVVLVVEDEATVRALVLEVLRELGYHVFEAEDGPSAMAILQSRQRLDLLLTDIGLPGLNGRQLAEAARQARPELKVLFMTGYAETAAAARGFLEPGMEMLPKPFELDVLAARVEAMLKRD